MRTDLLIIDPQKDFCDNPATPGHSGSLFVAGADKSAKRLGELILQNLNRIHRIVMTLDSHYGYHVGNPLFWMDANGDSPDPFTIITHQDVKDGRWTARRPGHRLHALDYTAALEANGRYPLCIWPFHCIIGSDGYAITQPVFEAVDAWEKSHFTLAQRVTKGSNWKTEHYSALQADVPDTSDSTTLLNTGLIQSLQNADRVLLTGQALSHCVANTVRDIADNFGEENIKKLELIIDTTNNVTGFENLGDQFVQDLTKRGMKTVNAADVF